MDRVKFDGIMVKLVIVELLTPRADAVCLGLFIHTLEWLTPPQQHSKTNHVQCNYLWSVYLSMYTCIDVQCICMCSVQMYVVYLSMQCMSGCTPPHSTQKQKHSSQLVTQSQQYTHIIVVHPSQQLHMSQQLYLHHSG